MDQDRIGQSLLLVIVVTHIIGMGSILLDCIFSKKDKQQ